MAERRKSRKRNAGSEKESKRLSLLDLPSAGDPGGDLPTNPRLVVRSQARTTLLPAAGEPVPDASLASLAEAARRSSSPPPRRDPLVSDFLAEAAARAPAPGRTEPSPPPFAPESTMPPPVQMPSDPPRMRVERRGNAWLKTLGVIVLSAGVGAGVSSMMSTVKGELAGNTPAFNGPRLALQPTATCAPTMAAPLPPENQHATGLATATAASTLEAPRIAFDALPVGQSTRRAAVEPASFVPASSERPARHADSPSGHAARAEAPLRSNREAKHSAEPPTPRALPLQPSRASLGQAVERAASAATACDSGPQDGKVAVTFAPSGGVQSVSLIKGFGDTAVNGCVLRAFGRAKVPAFSGDAVQVRKSIAW